MMNETTNMMATKSMRRMNMSGANNIPDMNTNMPATSSLSDLNTNMNVSGSTNR